MIVSPTKADNLGECESFLYGKMFNLLCLFEVK